MSVVQTVGVFVGSRSAVVLVLTVACSAGRSPTRPPATAPASRGTYPPVWFLPHTASAEHPSADEHRALTGSTRAALDRAADPTGPRAPTPAVRTPVPLPWEVPSVSGETSLPGTPGGAEDASSGATAVTAVQNESSDGAHGATGATQLGQTQRRETHAEEAQTGSAQAEDTQAEDTHPREGSAAGRAPSHDTGAHLPSSRHGSVPDGQPRGSVAVRPAGSGRLPGVRRVHARRSCPASTRRSPWPAARPG